MEEKGSIVMWQSEMSSGTQTFNFEAPLEFVEEVSQNVPRRDVIDLEYLIFLVGVRIRLL